MYKIPANTLFIGQNLIFVPECHSTNTLASELAVQSRLSDGTVVITANQTAGRGQRGNSWQSAAGRNLTFSIFLRPTFLSPRNQFFLTMAASLAVADFLTSLSLDAVKIKWPNDVLVGRKKISGILIENAIQGESIQQSIVGIGLNVNQQTFDLSLATSLVAFTNEMTDLNVALSALLVCFERRYFQAREGNYDRLRTDYLQQLYGLGQLQRFHSSDGPFEGLIEDVNEKGELIILKAGRPLIFNLKEISFVLTD